MNKYEVKRNGCKCNPHHCGCNDWAIFKDNEKLTTIYDKDCADHLVNAITTTTNHCIKLLDLIGTLSEVYSQQLSIYGIKEEDSEILTDIRKYIESI